MKKIIKLIILALALSLTVAAFALSSFADGEAEAAQAFSVYDKDGNKTDEGTDLEQLRAMAASLADGSTIVLETDMMASNALYFASTEESPRVINMDLNGKKYIPRGRLLLLLLTQAPIRRLIFIPRLRAACFTVPTSQMTEQAETCST